nr:hypothetical protein [Streptomyces phaeoluteigriseus]
MAWVGRAAGEVRGAEHAVEARNRDGSGPTAAGRRRRESVRMQAAELFEQNIKPPEVQGVCG